MVDLLAKIFQPNWAFFPKVVSPLIDTIKMSILGTVIGCVLALPVAILSSSNINKSIVIVVFSDSSLASSALLPTLIIALVCAYLLPRHLLRHRCHCDIHLRHRGEDAL